MTFGKKIIIVVAVFIIIAISALVFFLPKQEPVATPCEQTKELVQNYLGKAVKNPGASYSSGLKIPLYMCEGEVWNVNDFTGDYNSFKLYNYIGKPTTYKAEDKEKLFSETSFSTGVGFKAGCTCSQSLDCYCSVSVFDAIEKNHTIIN